MSNENLDRSNPAKFVQYMQENPFYFQDIFYLPFTPENANKALKEMGFCGFVGTVTEPKKPTVHRKRIEKKAKTEETIDINSTTLSVYILNLSKQAKTEEIVNANVTLK